MRNKGIPDGNKKMREGIAMAKKDIIGGALLLGALVAVLIGMALLQPEPDMPAETAYELKGFPSLPVSNQ